MHPGWPSPDKKLIPQVHSSSATEFLSTGWNSGKAWAFIPSRYNSSTRILLRVILCEKHPRNSLQSRNSWVPFQMHRDKTVWLQMWMHTCKTLLQQKHSGSNVFIQFLHINVFVDVCNRVETWRGASWDSQHPSWCLLWGIYYLRSKPEHLPRFPVSRSHPEQEVPAEVSVNRVRVGTCIPTISVLCDLHVGDICKHVAEPKVYMGPVNPNPPPWAETFIPVAYFSSGNSVSYVHLYEQC